MLRVLLRRFFLVLVLAAVPLPALAQRAPSYDAVIRQAIAAAQAGDYATARRLLAPIAGHPHAAYMLGLMDARGDGGPVDNAAAARHFSVGAAQGHPGAIFNLGYLHDRGWGVARDGAMAQQLYAAIAMRGELMAKNNLAYLWARQGGLLEQALCLSAETLAAQPDNVIFLDTYGFVLLRMNQPERAEAYFRKVLGKEPERVDALEHMGDVSSLMGRGDAAEWWRRASQHARDDRQRARLAAKLGGAPAMHDIDNHPPFPLRDPGVPKNCAIPAV